MRCRACVPHGRAYMYIVESRNSYVLREYVDYVMAFLQTESRPLQIRLCGVVLELQVRVPKYFYISCGLLKY